MFNKNSLIGVLKIFRFGDFIIILLSVLALIWLTVSIYATRGSAESIMIRSDSGEAVYDLSIDQHISVDGPIGEVHVVIENGTAFIEDSPCEDQLCVKMGVLSKPGDWSACLPGRVMVEVLGKRDEELDDVSF